MNAQTPVLHHYESIAAASAKMLAAARAADWDALIEAEGECAHHIDALRRAATAPLPGTAADRRRHDIIRTVLAHDAEIRTLTQPWMEKLELLLHSASAGRRVEQTYR